MLNGGVGSYSDNPIVINPGDIDVYKDQIVDQNPSITLDMLGPNIEKNYQITFSTDDPPQIFEVYRLDFAPRSYRDFASGRKRVLRNTVRGSVVMTANSAVDAIVPNKKYWYTFRTIDVHGNMSNPSGILQLEMVDTGNSIYPLIEEYTFPQKPASYTKPMGRYLMVAPSSNQETKHKNAKDAHSFANHHQLGPDLQKKMWGKKYKLRLTSKLTGKKIDVNFTFKQGPPPETDKL